MAITYLANGFNPQVAGDMVAGTLPKKIKFAPIAKIDTTLEAIAGDSITIPKWGMLAEADEILEGIAMVPEQMTSTYVTKTIKEWGKAVEITERAKIASKGDPYGEGLRQVSLSIASKADTDCYQALLEATAVYNPGTAVTIGYENIVKANALFGDESDASLAKVMFIHPDQETTLLLDSNFISNDKYNADVIMNGHIGKVAGCEIVKSKKVLKANYDLSTSGTSGAVKIVTSGATSGQVDIADVYGIWDATNKKAVAPAVDLYVTAKDNTMYYNPIVVVDAQDPDEDPNADNFGVDMPAVTIYLKKSAQVKVDEDILKRTTVIAGNEYGLAALTNDSKVVLACYKNA